MKDTYNIQDIMHGYARWLNETSRKTSVIHTGFVELDKLGGFSNGLNIIGSRPAVSKPSLVASMIVNLALMGRRIALLWYGNYDNQRMWMRYIAENICRIEGIDLSQDRPDEWKKLDNVQLDKYHIYLHQFRFLADLELSVLDLTMCENVNYIFVDCLQDIHMDGMMFSPSELRFNPNLFETNIVCKRLKLLSSQIDRPVIVLSQLNKRPKQERGTNRELPQIQDIRDCDIAEDYADNIYLLYQSESDNTVVDIDEQDVCKIKVVVQKNKNGHMDIIELKRRNHCVYSTDYPYSEVIAEENKKREKEYEDLPF